MFPPTRVLARSVTLGAFKASGSRNSTRPAHCVGDIDSSRKRLGGDFPRGMYRWCDIPQQAVCTAHCHPHLCTAGGRARHSAGRRLGPVLLCVCVCVWEVRTFPAEQPPRGRWRIGDSIEPISAPLVSFVVVLLCFHVCRIRANLAKQMCRHGRRRRTCSGECGSVVFDSSLRERVRQRSCKTPGGICCCWAFLSRGGTGRPSSNKWQRRKTGVRFRLDLRGWGCRDGIHC